MTREFTNGCPQRLPACNFLSQYYFYNISYKSIAGFLFKLSQSSRRRKPEVALVFAFDRCVHNKPLTLVDDRARIKNTLTEMIKDVDSRPGVEKFRRSGFPWAFTTPCHPRPGRAALLSAQDWVSGFSSIRFCSWVLFTGWGSWPHAQPSSFIRAWDRQGTGLSHPQAELKW